MKTKLFTIAALAAMLFASCAKDGQTHSVDKGEKARIKLAVVGNGSSSRALDPVGPESGGYQADTKVAVNDATVFVMGASGIIGAPTYLSNADLTTYVEKETTTAAKKVVIIGNIGSDQTGVGGIFDGVTTEAGLNDVLADFKDMDDAHKWLTGVSDPIDWDTATTIASGANAGEKLITMTVALAPIAARIDVLVDVSGFTNFTDPAAKIKFTDVAVLYSAANTHFTGSPLVPAASTTDPAELYYYSGFDWDPAGTLQKSNTKFLADTEANYPMLCKEWAANYTAAPTAPALNFEESFYAFPGNGAYGKFTIVTVYGFYDENGNGTMDAGETRFWPVHFTADDVPGDILKNGKIYTMTLRFQGNAGLDGGTTDPEEPLTAGFLTVNIVDRGWETVAPFEKIFN